jgi:hypothetical protein
LPPCSHHRHRAFGPGQRPHVGWRVGWPIHGAWEASGNKRPADRGHRTAVYVGLVIGLQALLRGVTKQDSSLAIVISTLAIAALFQPLRHSLQQFIDRRFYRSKYDAAEIIETFSARLQSEVDLSQLKEQLLAVVQETTQPTFVSLWVRPSEHGGRYGPLQESHSS